MSGGRPSDRIACRRSIWGAVKTRTFTYANGQNRQIWLLDVDAKVSMNGEIDSILTRVARAPDVRLRYAAE
ncbi:hypothetical protein OKW43_007767 [Paraburkholderia sp. WC7.3g]